MLADVGAAVLTALSLGLLACGGTLFARLVLGARAERDLLAFAVAAGVGAIAQATAIGILLGAIGRLELWAALAVQGALVATLGGWRAAAGMVRTLAIRSFGVVRAHPALALIAAHAVGVEVMRGALRPPLSWDSLMYHLYLTATWLKSRAIEPVFAADPLLTHSYFPANGSVWLWWWMAPSHSELYVNLAYLPQTLLLAVASGGVARELGARRQWPLAVFLVLSTPAVLRWATAQNSDVPLAATFVAACFFALRWRRDARWCDAVLAGLAAGIALGTKAFGPPYCLVLAIASIATASGHAGRRVAQAASASALALLLGGYFYARNLALGIGVLGLGCGPEAPGGMGLAELPWVSPLTDWFPALRHTDWLARGFLGDPAAELGIGPQALLLLVGLLVLPFALRAERRAALVVSVAIVSQVAIVLSFQAQNMAYLVTNLRYMMGAIALALAGGVALVERLGVAPAHSSLIAIALAAQGLLQVGPALTTGERLGIAITNVVLVALVCSSRLREGVRRHLRPVAVAAVAGALAFVPTWADFRAGDRARALLAEGHPHASSARHFARAWGWLDRHGGDGAIAVATEPEVIFVYPAMGARLERTATYVNVNVEDHRASAAYAGCDPRVRPSAPAWLANLAKLDIRWIHVGRYPGMRFPVENRWAKTRPESFALRYRDRNNRIYERVPEVTRQASWR